MTREETKKCIEVMRAFLEGKEIQMYSHVSKKWEDNPNPSFQWGYCDYRIKPEEEINIFPASEKELEAIKRLGLIYKYRIESGNDYRILYKQDLIELSHLDNWHKDKLIYNPQTNCWESWDTPEEEITQ